MATHISNVWRTFVLPLHYFSICSPILDRKHGKIYFSCPSIYKICNTKDSSSSTFSELKGSFIMVKKHDRHIYFPFLPFLSKTWSQLLKVTFLFLPFLIWNYIPSQTLDLINNVKGREEIGHKGEMLEGQFFKNFSF